MLFWVVEPIDHLGAHHSSRPDRMDSELQLCHAGIHALTHILLSSQNPQPFNYKFAIRQCSLMQGPGDNLGEHVWDASRSLFSLDPHNHHEPPNLFLIIQNAFTLPCNHYCTLEPQQYLYKIDHVYYIMCTQYHAE